MRYALCSVLYYCSHRNTAFFLPLPSSMPRSVDVVLRHEAVERAKPGDKATFTGTLIVIPDISKV